MKKLKIIIILVFALLILVCCVRFYSKGHDTVYKIGKNNKYEIHEIYTKNAKNELDNYYLEITVDKNTFHFQLFETYSEKREIVEDVIYYSGEYKCLLPIIDKKAQTDILCYKNNRYYNYTAIIGKEAKLDIFVNEIDNKIYNKNDFLDKSNNTKEFNGITLYTDNILKNHYIAISNLKGVFLINNKVENVKIFEKDIYTRKLSAVVDGYYVTADYSANQQFRTFYFIELATKKIKEAKAPNYISFDSYIQGVVDGKLYIYDKDNEKQYEIDVSKQEIEEIGNSKKKVKYYNSDDWDKITTTKANKETKFNYLIEDNDLSKFDYIYLVGGEYSGYYYLFQKADGYYRVYRSPVQNKKAITYLFSVYNVDDIYYMNEYVYYKKGNKLKYYSDYTGNKTLLEYNELEFNENIVFGVYGDV